VRKFIFIDKKSGDDANDGLSPDKPRRTFLASTSDIIYEIADTRITSKQIAAARFLLLGYDNKSIALELGIAVRTVKAYMAALMRIFHVKNRIALAIALMRNQEWSELLVDSSSSI